jgi:hypothetical protein
MQRQSTPNPNSSNAQCAQWATPNDARYKSAFVDFIKARTWHWFITIPIGECEDDDSVKRRLRVIEASLCKKWLVNRYNKLPDSLRFVMAVAFEGEYRLGTRHAHLLVYVPESMKRRVSHFMASELLPYEFRLLWNQLRQTENCQSATQNALTDMITSKMRIGRTSVARKIYTVKDVRSREVLWSDFEFVTPPRIKDFTNENLSVIQNRDQQRRRSLGLR